MSNNGWIRVDERLPDEVVITARYSDTHRVLVVASGVVCIATLRRRRGSSCWLDDEVFPVMHVTHWQPLPPPPETK